MSVSGSPEILILGGGVIGLTTAYYLAREGARVAVLDRGDFGQESSWAGAGIISPGHPDRARSPLGKLRGRSAALFPELSAELLDKTGIDNGYVRCGGLELRRSADSLERQRLENLLREERGEGTHCEVLDGGPLREREPALSERITGAVFLPEMAQVRNPRHLKALVAACGQLGVALHAGCAAGVFERSGDRILAVETSAGRIAAGQFLLAAGAWSGGLLRDLGEAPRVKPVRGQIVLLRTEPPFLRQILLAGSEYLVPRPDGRVLVGSTEEDVGFDKRTTAEAVSHLLDFALGLVPALAQAPVERAWAGLRPGSEDGRPYLGPVPGLRNLFIAAGHYRAGLQLSPGTAWAMMELLLGKPPFVPLDAFRLDRRH